MSGQGIQLLIPLIAIPFISRKLDIADFALAMASLSIVQFGYIITEYGSSIVGSEYAKKYGSDGIETIRSSLFIMRLIATLTYFILIFSIFPILSEDFWITFAALLCLITFTIQPIWVYNSKQKFGSLTIAVLLGKVIYLIFILNVLSFFPNVVTVLIAVIIGNLTTALLLISMPHGKIVMLRLNLFRISHVAKDGAEILLSRVCQNVHFFLGIPIVLMFSDTSSAASYAAAETVVRAMRGIVGASTQAGFQFILQSKKFTFFIYYLLFVSFFSLFMATVALFSTEIIHETLFDKQFQDFSHYLKLLILVFGVSAMNQVFGYPAFTLLNSRKMADLTSIVLPIIIVFSLLILITETQDFPKIWILSMLIGESVLLSIRAFIFFSIKVRKPLT